MDKILDGLGVPYLINIFNWKIVFGVLARGKGSIEKEYISQKINIERLFRKIIPNKIISL